MASDKKSFNTDPLIVGTLVLLALAFFALAINRTFLADGHKGVSDEEFQAAVAERIRPLGSVLLPGQEAQAAGPQVPEAEPVAPVATSMTGPQVYNEACITCHGSGIGGAPLLADAAAWSDRITQGSQTLYDHAINGYTGSAGFMPQKGGRLDLSDDEVIGAVDYMVNESQ